MSHERGVAPVPRIALLSDLNAWAPWAKWFERLVEAVYRVRIYEQSLDVANVTASSESVQTFTVTGLSTSDVVEVNKQSNTAGLDLVQAWCSATDTLSLKFRNATGADINPAAETYLIKATRK